MNVETYLFGKVEIDPEKIISFPAGLAGFEDCKSFMLVHDAEQGAPVSYTLQAVDDPALAFQIVDPADRGFNYSLSLSDAENALLGTPAPDEIVVMQLLFKQQLEGQDEIMPSLRAPLIINTAKRLGLQKVMERVVPSITLSNLSSPV